MSRSNYDKPFYVDVGTSIVAIRCASNHDVIEKYDYVMFPHTLELAKEICDRMNKEAEIGRPRRNCDVGTAEEQYVRFEAYCDNEVCNRKNCGCSCKTLYSDECALEWSQMPYESEVK